MKGLLFGNRKMKSGSYNGRNVIKVYFGDKQVWPSEPPAVAFDPALHHIEVTVDDASKTFFWTVKDADGNDLKSSISKSYVWVYRVGTEGAIFNRAGSLTQYTLNEPIDGEYFINVVCESKAGGKIPGSGTYNDGPHIIVGEVPPTRGFDMIVVTISRKDGEANNINVCQLKVNDATPTDEEFVSYEIYNPWSKAWELKPDLEKQGLLTESGANAYVTAMRFSFQIPSISSFSYAPPSWWSGNDDYTITIVGKKDSVETVLLTEDYTVAGNATIRFEI